MVSLPKIELPVYEVNLISRGLTKFRPFTVKEQKILMGAIESKQFDSAIGAIKQVIGNCLLDQNIDVDELPMIDLELMFLSIRAKSMGEKVNLYFKCDQKLVGADGNTKPCGMVLEVEANIEELEPIIPVEKTVQLTEDITVEMKYPSFALINLLQSQANTMVDAELIVIGGCMNKIYHGVQMTDMADASIPEVLEFLGGLGEQHYRKLAEWVRKTPKIRKTVEKTCVKCNKHHKMTLEGLADFFM